MRKPERHTPEANEPACPFCGPVPPGARTALCYDHYRRSRHFSYSELFLQSLEEFKREWNERLEKEREG